MQQLIKLETIEQLNGKYIIQLNHDNPNVDITKGDAGFWMEKRIRLVTFIGTRQLIKNYNAVTNEKMLVAESSIYGTEFLRTLEEYVKHFNGEDQSSRFHRLLTAKEIRWYAEELVKRNY